MLRSQYLGSLCLWYKGNYLGTVFSAPALLPLQQPSWFTLNMLAAVNYLGGGSLAAGPRPEAAQFQSQVRLFLQSIVAGVHVVSDLFV